MHSEFVEISSALKKEKCFCSLCYLLVSLLSGARNKKNGHLAKERSRVIQELFPDQRDQFASVSVLLANTLSLSGALEEAYDVRRTLAQSSWKRRAGLSWTEVNGEFVVNDFIPHCSSSISFS